MPLALFDAMRTDYSLKRIVHYTGTDWRPVQPWILLTNYHRYVDQFVTWGVEPIARQCRVLTRCILPGGVIISRECNAMLKSRATVGALGLASLPDAGLSSRRGGDGGVSLVNIGVGSSNAKNITDHLAVLRPHCWLMIGHCGGLRQSQRIGDYVLAHAYLRQDRILDAPCRPIFRSPLWPKCRWRFRKRPRR